jgi:hypothetical protein
MCSEHVKRKIATQVSTSTRTHVGLGTWVVALEHLVFFYGKKKKNNNNNNHKKEEQQDLFLSLVFQ